MGKITFASVISEIQQSDVFMTVKARICEAPEANLNGARVTEAFIDEIVGNETRYVGLPLYADKKALISGSYNRLGHLYDEKTGEFHSTQIGSFYKFEKQVNGESCALIGYARIPKRNKKLSKAISELFADGALKFSFELTVGEYEELDDNTILIDASENNYLEGTAIVTYPACEDAVALELVAQKADEAKGGESEMAEVENKAEVVETEAAQPEVAEVEETKEETSEVDAACKEKKEKAEEETAEVVVREFHDESHTQVAFDTESGKEVRQTVTISTESTNVTDGELVESVDGVHVAEAEIAEADGDTPAGDPPAGDNTGDSTTGDTPGKDEEGGEDEEETVEDPPVINVEQKKTAEQMIAELMEMVNSLKSEIAELKEQKVNAEAKQVTAEINPFMGEISAKGKYSLLEKEPKRTSYSLLEKA